MRPIALLTVALLTLVVTTGCGDSLSNRDKGALGGTALGAGLGAIIGSATGNAGVGTAIGGGIGAITGAVVGNEIDKSEEIDAAKDARLDDNDRILTENQRILEELKRQGADARITDRGVVVNLPDVLFEFDRADLTSRANATISEIAVTLKSGPERNIAVEGHTDSVGTMSYNQELSDRRARSVARELERQGISRARLYPRGFGEGDPIASNKTEVGRARNRRVEVIIENSFYSERIS